MEWFYLALISALSFAFGDAFSKKYFQGNSSLEMFVVRFSLPGVLLLPVALTGDYPALNSEFWIWVILLIPLELIAMALYWMAIRDSALHLTLPYLAFTPVINVLTANVILGESIDLQNLLGILLVVCGAYLLNIRTITRFDPRKIFNPLMAIFTERGSRLMLLAAVVYSFTSVLGKGAAVYVDTSKFGAFFYAVIGFSVLILVILTKPTSLKIVVAKPGPSLLVAICMSLMVVTHFLAIVQINVAYMIAVKRTSLLFGIILGAILFSEKHLPQHFIAGAIMVAGVAIILI